MLFVSEGKRNILYYNGGIKRGTHQIILRLFTSAVFTLTISFLLGKLSGVTGHLPFFYTKSPVTPISFIATSGSC